VLEENTSIIETEIIPSEDDNKDEE